MAGQAPQVHQVMQLHEMLQSWGTVAEKLPGGKELGHWLTAV